MEQKIKTLIGEYIFQICALTMQLEEKDKRISELEGSQIKVNSNNQTGGITTMGVVTNNTGIISQ